MDDHRREELRGMLEQVSAYACALGVVEVRRDPSGLVLHYHGRDVELAGEAGGPIAVRWGHDARARIVHDGSWWLDSDEGRVPLFDVGVERLVREGLGLPPHGS